MADGYFITTGRKRRKFAPAPGQNPPMSVNDPPESAPASA
jgi:hypothetical protein